MHIITPSIPFHFHQKEKILILWDFMELSFVGNLPTLSNVGP